MDDSYSDNLTKMLMPLLPNLPDGHDDSGFTDVIESLMPIPYDLPDESFMFNQLLPPSPYHDPPDESFMFNQPLQPSPAVGDLVPAVITDTSDTHHQPKQTRGKTSYQTCPIPGCGREVKRLWNHIHQTKWNLDQWSTTCRIHLYPL